MFIFVFLFFGANVTGHFITENVTFGTVCVLNHDVLFTMLLTAIDISVVCF